MKEPQGRSPTIVPIAPASSYASRAAVAAAVRWRMGQPLGMIHPRWPRVVTSRSRTSPSSVIRNGKAPVLAQNVVFARGHRRRSANSARLLSTVARVVASALIGSSLPMRCRCLEPAPLLVQRPGSGKAVARLPAHDHADASLDTPRKLVPLKRRQQRRGHRRIVVMAQCILQPGNACEETGYLIILPLGVPEELRGISQLLQGYPDLVTVFGSKAPKMCPPLHDRPMQMRQGATGEVVRGLQQHGEGFALKLIAPAARMDPLAYRQLQPVVSRAGKRLVETCIGPRWGCLLNFYDSRGFSGRGPVLAARSSATAALIDQAGAPA